MSALAHILLQRGERVSGSDLSESVATQALRKEGAEIHIGQNKQTISPGMRVVYSTAIQLDNPEFIAAKESGAALFHRKDLLNQFLSEKKSLIVTGSHGKTTTSSLLAWTLSCARLDPSFIIGGIPSSLKTNGYEGKGEYFVAEGDESDGSGFTHPVYGGILTNIDADHLDYWKTKEALYEGFLSFNQKVKNPDRFFLCGADAQFKGCRYGTDANCELRAVDILQEEERLRFSVHFEGKIYEDVVVNLRGEHNALNSLAVFGLATSLGVSEEDIRIAFTSFEGVKRRAEFKGERKNIHIFDDYAHHPTEIRALIKGFGASKPPGSRLIIAFQPHKYSRTQQCQAEFSRSFEGVDALVITDIYPAGEDPIEGVSGESLLEKVQAESLVNASYVPLEKLTQHLVQSLKPHDMLITVGAGDITELGPKVLDGLYE